MTGDYGSQTWDAVQNHLGPSNFCWNERPFADIHTATECCNAATPRQALAALKNFGEVGPMRTKALPP